MEDRDPLAEDADSPDVRARIIDAAAELIAKGGAEAATTRAVAAAAGVQAPTIYRLFGDKRGLLAAVVQEVLGRYVAEKAARAPHPDPMQDFRDGWDMHLAFALSHPGLFAIMSSEAQPAWETTASGGDAILRRRIQNLARAGRLRVSEERAFGLIRAMGTGLALTLLQRPPAERDAGLADAARESVVAAITSGPALPPNAGVRGAATALRASLDETTVLSKGERQLLAELLDRIADGA